MAKKTLILIGFILLKFFLQYFLISPGYELHRDEYLHLDQGNHLAWGFVSVPPVTACVSYVIGWFGNGVFWVKFFPALFGALTIWVVWKTIERLGGNLFALVLGATCLLFSALLRLNMLHQPNSLDILCWTAFYYIVIQYVHSKNTKWLFIGAVVFAIGFLNKYNIAFLLLGLSPALLVEQESRKLLWRPQLIWALLLALLLVTPHVLWQYRHHFPVIHHMRELADTQLVNVNRTDFLKDQLLFFIGGVPVIFFACYALLFHKPLRPYRFFFAAFLVTLLVFMCLRAKSYYAVGLYPVYIAFGAVYLSDALKDGWKRYLKPVFILVPVLLFVPIFDIAFPNKPPQYIAEHGEKYKDLGLLRWEDGKDRELPQDFADMIGWEELAAKTDSTYAALSTTGKTLVLCDNYGQAGAINYYTKRGIKAVSFNADYIDWFDLTQPYKHLIRVKEKQEGDDDELKETAPYFRTAEVAGKITNPLAREFGTTIFAFGDAGIDINSRIESEISSIKAAMKE